MPWMRGRCQRCNARTEVWSQDCDESDVWLCDNCLGDDVAEWAKEEQQRLEEDEWPADWPPDGDINE